MASLMNDVGYENALNKKSHDRNGRSHSSLDRYSWQDVGYG